MILKNEKSSWWLLDKIASKIWHKRVTIILLCILSVLMILIGIYTNRSGVLGSIIKPIVYQNIKVIPNYLNGLFSDPSKLIIDISFKKWSTIVYKQNQAIKRGRLITSSDDFVSALITYENKSYPCNVRLKGDLEDHWNTNKWSLRIKLKGDQTLFGMKTFSIQHPKTRGFLSEWFWHQLLEYENLIHLRYDFIKVEINGKNYGIYAIEENFDKRLIENNKLREGPIVSWDEDIFWNRPKSLNGQLTTKDLLLYSNYNSYQTSKTLSDPLLKDHYLKAITVLDMWRNKKIDAADAFDIEKLAKFWALCHLTGARHAQELINIRFYYNPITSRLEPIGFDSGIIKSIGTDNYWKEMDEKSMTYLLKSDITFMTQFQKELERISSDNYIESFLAKINNELDNKRSILHAEWPYYSFSLEKLYDNQKYIRSYLYQNHCIIAYLDKKDTKHLIIEVANLFEGPVEIAGCLIGDSIKLDLSEQRIVLNGMLVQPGSEMEYSNIIFDSPDTLIIKNDRDIKIQYRLMGTENYLQNNVIPHERINDQLTPSSVQLIDNTKSFNFFNRDDSRKILEVKKGLWEVRKNIIIPKDYTLLIQPGTTIDLIKGSGIIIPYSSIHCIGTVKEKIRITSTDSTGQGIFVFNSNDTSYIYNTQFEHINSFESLTGAVTFYESPVMFDGTDFLDIKAEDALNIIRSDFTMNNSFFNTTSSDGIDIDFGKGIVQNTTFNMIGNDAIDFSGSTIELYNLEIHSAGDKGISVGEASRVQGSNVIVTDSKIGFACKDLSSLILNSISIDNSSIGFAVFNKKSEFGPGKMKISDYKISNIETNYFVEENSTLLLDGRPVDPSGQNLKEKLY